MFRKWLLPVVTGVVLAAGMAPAAEAHPSPRDRDFRPGRRDDDRGRDWDRGRDRDRGDGRVFVLPDPGVLTGFRGQNGQTLYFEVTGSQSAGAVWGTDLYTDDSSLAAAAVHAGALADGQTGVVKVTILPGAAGYRATCRNGVESGNWGGWVGSYRIER
jgi:Ni/Co efflux regulator RcnB